MHGKLNEIHWTAHDERRRKQELEGYYKRKKANAIFKRLKAKRKKKASNGRRNKK